MTTTITVDGMSCGHCEQTGEEALQEVSGVTDVIADAGPAVPFQGRRFRKLAGPPVKRI
ncbi:cation transporter (plasmid) [Halorussus salilacus]|uniref:heavy-metal-associated domain-containing protein n=1 Tax=Halorussus salilacus TaxID=2953750 RepID=UPI0020A0798D|nr:cation transporter [Halorussus salilacus]USZ70158.1 cation transporter [Halorussus salilacus]